MSYFFVLIAYLSGSIPYGLILTKTFGGIDIRTIGSGNIGTTNVLRTGHKSIAIATLLCDALKGFLPVYIAAYLGLSGTILLIIAYAAVLGHVFPIWLKFKGGKGIATSLGVFWALSLPLGLFSTLTWGLIAQFIKISSLASLWSFVLTPIFATLFLSKPLALFSLAIALLTLQTHRSNIQRLLKGEEKEMGRHDNN